MTRTLILAALLAAATLAAAAPAMAQSMTLPSVALPDPNTGWGCRFYGTCAPLVTRNGG